MALLEVQGLTKRFGGLVALKDVSFNVEQGEIHGLIGPNGSGKTTMINTLSGIYRADGGRAVFDGVVTTRLPGHSVARCGVARTFQEIQVFPDMTVFENAQVGSHRLGHAGVLGGIYGMGWVKAEEAKARERAREALAFVGIERWANELARNLPYGHQRLLEIARALASEPKLLLLDEPAAGLNPAESEELMTLIVRISARSTVLLVEHNIRLVMNVCHGVTVLDYGRRIADGAPAAIQQDPVVVEAYLGVQYAPGAGADAADR